MTARAAHPSLFSQRLAMLLPARVAERLFDVAHKATTKAWTLICAMVRPVETSAPAMSREALQRFQSTIVPHLDSAYNFARYLCRDPDAASDIVQDAFLRAYRAFDGYRGGDARAWLFAIIRNCHRAWQHEGQHKARYETSMTADDDDAEQPIHGIASDADTPEAWTIRRSEQTLVRRVIAGLSEPMREVLVLRELEDFSYRQISEVLGIPVGTVMSRLARARDAFGEAWRALEAGEATR